MLSKVSQEKWEHCTPNQKVKGKHTCALFKRTQAPSDQCLKWKHSRIKQPGFWPFCMAVYQICLWFLWATSLFSCTAASPSVPRRALIRDFMRVLVTGCNLDINTLTAIKTITWISPRELSSPFVWALLCSHLTFSSCLAKALFRWIFCIKMCFPLSCSPTRFCFFLLASLIKMSPLLFPFKCLNN